MRMRRGFTNYTNPDTGEIQKVPVMYQDRTPCKEDFAMIFQKTRLALVKNDALRAQDYRILAYLEAVTDYDGQLPDVTAASIGRDLALDRSNVNKALHRLQAAEVLDRNENGSWRFHIDAVWKGDLESRERFRIARMQARSAQTDTKAKP